MKSIACLSLLIVVSACGGPEHPEFITPPVQSHAGAAGDMPVASAGAAGEVEEPTAGSAGASAGAGSTMNSAGSAGKMNTAGSAGSIENQAGSSGASAGSAGTPAGGAGGSNVAGMGGSSVGGTGGSATGGGGSGNAGSPSAGTGGAVDTCEPSDREGTFNVVYTYHQELSTCASEPMHSFKTSLSVVKPQASAGCNLAGSKVQDECLMNIGYKCVGIETFTIDVLSQQVNVDGSKFTGQVTVQNGCVAVYSFIATK